jgi:hypothetical protein
VRFQCRFRSPITPEFSGRIFGFSAFDLFADNEVGFNTKLRDVVYNASRNDFITVNEQIET